MDFKSLLFLLTHCQFWLRNSFIKFTLSLGIIKRTQKKLWEMEPQKWAYPQKRDIEPQLKLY